MLILLNDYASFLKSRQLTTKGQTRGHGVLTSGLMLLSLVRAEVVTPLTVRCNTMYFGRCVPAFLNLYQPTCCHVPEDGEFISRSFFNTCLQISVSNDTPKLKLHVVTVQAMKACEGFVV